MCLYNIKSFKLKNNIFLYQKCFKSRLCFYINLDFLLFHFISAKIYISQLYKLNLKSFTSNNKNFCYLKKLKVVVVPI